MDENISNIETPQELSKADSKQLEKINSSAIGDEQSDSGAVSIECKTQQVDNSEKVDEPCATVTDAETDSEQNEQPTDETHTVNPESIEGADTVEPEPIDDSEDTDVEPSEIIFSTNEHCEDCSIYGVTFLGRNHKSDNSTCQDRHLFINMGDGWYCLVVSDGAGSASQSHRGAKINCELSCHLLSKLVDKLGWKNRETLPTEIEWHMQFYELCRSLKKFTADKVESLDEKVTEKDFNATLIVAIVSPLGIMTGHLGDGRMGYLDMENTWHTLMTPHRGDEPNQTVFIMNAWDKVRFPHLTMSGALVPETHVVLEKPKAIVLLTDGCENFCWNCTQFDESKGVYRDINTPFAPFWARLIDKLEKSASYDEAFSAFAKYVDTGTAPCRDEGDDRSLILGIFNN
jgi:hypothetical protein